MAYGFKYTKNTGRSPGQHPYTPENMKHVGWCIKKGIKIFLERKAKGQLENWELQAQ